MIRLSVRPGDAEPFERSFTGESLTIGRAEDADLSVDDRFLSRRHARLFLQDGRLMVEDLGSVNGTLLNGARIDSKVPIRSGDELKLSSTRISILEDGQAPRPSEPARLADRALPEGTVLIPSAELLTQFVAADSGALLGEESLRRQADHLAILNEVHTAVAGSIELQQLLDLILDRAFDHLEPDEGAVFLRSEAGDYSRVASRGREGIGGDYLYSQTLVTEVSEKGLAALVLDAQQDERFSDAASILDSGVRSLIAAPLTHPEGSVGMIALNSSLNVRQFTEDDLQLLTSLASVAALRVWTLSLAEEAAERRKMQGELDLARKIQVALLPEKLPTVPSFEIRAFNTPSRGVSGDFHEVLSRCDGKEFVVFLADVSGKGMAASLLTATLEALAAVPILDGQAPDEICTRLSDLLEQRTPPERFATAFLAVIEQSSGAVSFASAGHNPCLIVRSSGEVENLDRTGLPLGLLPGASYTLGEQTLAPGDTLIVYSDGITEATNPEDDEYGLDRLAAVGVETRGEDLDALVAAVDRDLLDFAAGVPFADDLTLVVVRRTDDSPSP